MLRPGLLCLKAHVLVTTDYLELLQSVLMSQSAHGLTVQFQNFIACWEREDLQLRTVLPGQGHHPHLEMQSRPPAPCLHGARTTGKTCPVWCRPGPRLGCRQGGGGLLWHLPPSGKRSGSQPGSTHPLASRASLLPPRPSQHLLPKPCHKAALLALPTTLYVVQCLFLCHCLN